ncbi:MAG: ATPase domain-containing protein [Methanocellales archaeon]
MEVQFKKIPSGITSLDSVIGGGFPIGSLALLLGESGAGHIEFAYTSAIKLSIQNANSTLFAQNNVVIPKKILYISLTRSKSDVLSELAISFAPSYYEAVRKNIQFKDLSKIYFKKSSVPYSWFSYTNASIEDLKRVNHERNLLEALVCCLNEDALDSLVIIDSITALARSCAESPYWKDLISFLRGLQKISKHWNGLIYALMNSKIFDTQFQEEIIDCVDGALIFEWEESGAYQRQRTMYIKKFRGLMPHLEQHNIVKFETKITPDLGFEVSNIRQLFGRN